MPAELEGLIKPGDLVVAPFGSQTIQGVVLGLIETPEVAETKPILELVDAQPVLTADQLELGRWLAENTLSPLGACLNAMIPPGLSQHADLVVRLIPTGTSGVPAMAESSQPGHRKPSKTEGLPERILNLLKERESFHGRQLESAFPHQNWRAAIYSLKKQNLVTVQSILPPPSVRAKVGRTVYLAVPAEAIQAQMDKLGKTGSPAAERRLSILRFLQQEGTPVEVAWIYANSGGTSADL